MARWGRRSTHAFIEAAGGPDALIIDVPTAGGDSVYTPERAGHARLEAGRREEHLRPAHQRQKARRHRQLRRDPQEGRRRLVRGRPPVPPRRLVRRHEDGSRRSTTCSRAAASSAARRPARRSSATSSFAARRRTTTSSWTTRATRRASRTCGASASTSTSSRASGSPISPTRSSRSIPDLLGDLRGRRHRVGREGRHRDDHRPQQGVRLRRQGRDRSAASRSSRSIPATSYNLATRKVIHRARRRFAGDARRSSMALFSKYSDPSAGGATVLVAQDGKVLHRHSRTASRISRSTCRRRRCRSSRSARSPTCSPRSVHQLPTAGPRRCCAGQRVRGRRWSRRGRAHGTAATALQNCVARRVSTPIGMHKTNATRRRPGDVRRRRAVPSRPRPRGADTRSRATRSAHRAVRSGQGLDSRHATTASTRLVAYAVAGGKRSAFVRIPDQHASIIVLTNDDSADAKAIADKITDRLLGKTQR